MAKACGVKESLLWLASTALGQEKVPSSKRLS
jgi:hypothetical protein